MERRWKWLAWAVMLVILFIGTGAYVTTVLSAPPSPEYDPTLTPSPPSGEYLNNAFGITPIPSVTRLALADDLPRFPPGLPTPQRCSALQRGDLVAQTAHSPTGVAIIQGEGGHKIVWGTKPHLVHPVWDQRLDHTGSLRFRANETDILAFPVNGIGGPGTAARAEGRMQFAEPLAIGGFDYYGAAVQTNNTENRILFFEAYARSHHQTSVFATPFPIYWLGWVGGAGTFLNLVLNEPTGRHLYRLEPTFPDLTLARRDCFYSNKILTDCMLRAIKSTPRRLVKVLDHVEGIFVALGKYDPPGCIDEPR